MAKTINKFIFIGLLFLSLLSVNTSATQQGAYLVSRSTSYANPQTGKVSDGGTNIALGDNMANNVVEPQLLVEKTNNQSFITIGLGMASNIQNVSFKVNNQPVSAEYVSNSTRNNDQVNHYRIPGNEGSLVEVKMYVTPMQRDVIFYVQVGTDLVRGTGVYQSNLNNTVPVDETTSNKEQSNSQPTQETVAKQEVKKNTDKTSKQVKKKSSLSKHLSKKNKKKKDNSSLIYGSIGIIVSAALILGIIFWYKHRKL